MPRVSAEHLGMRRDQILDAARTCFARKGFHQSSMQDVIRESGLSAGAIYRYFKSKKDIIAALADRESSVYYELMDRIIGSGPLPPLDEIFGKFTAAVTAHADQDGSIRMAPHAWAAGLGDPDLLGSVRVPMTKLRATLERLAERMRDEGKLPADADPQAVAATLVCLVPGFVIQYLLLGDLDATTLRDGLRALVGSAVVGERR